MTDHTDATDAQFETLQSDNSFGDVTNVAAYIDDRETFAFTEVWIPDIDDCVTIEHSVSA